MDEETSKEKRNKKSKVWKRIFSALLIFVAILAAAAWIALRILNIGLPPVAADWLQRKLSEGYLCYTFDRASYTISDGIHLENARIYVKRVADEPLARADELDLKFKIRSGGPVYSWVSSAIFKGFKLGEIQNFSKGVEDEEDGTNKFADFLSLVSVKNEWLTTPIPVHFDQAELFGFSFRRVDALVSVYGGKLIVDNISADFNSSIAEETGAGAVKYDPVTRLLTANFSALALPPSVVGFLEYFSFVTVQDYFREMESFTVPFTVDGDIRWKFASRNSPSTKDCRISVDSSRYSFREIPIRNLKLNMQYLSPGDGGRYANRVVAVNPLSCQTDKGEVSTAFAYYPERHGMDLKVDSSIPLEYLFRFARQDYPSVLTNIVSDIPPDFKFSGRVMRKASGKPTYGGGAFSYDAVSVFGIPFSNCTSEISVVAGESVVLNNFKARLFGGDFGGDISFNFQKGSSVPHADISCKLTDAVSAEAFKFFGRDIADNDGKINATCTLAGIPTTNHLDSLHGAFEGHIRKTHLLRIPLFAGLTDFLATYVPGVNAITEQTQADVSATLTNGLISVSDFRVEGGLFSIVSDNTRCRINKEGIPIEGVAKLRFFKQESIVGQIMRFATLPVSKMMEFRLTGPVSHPTWNYIGLIDRITNLFGGNEDATALDESTTQKKSPEEDTKREEQ